MATDTTTKTRVSGGAVRTLDGAADILSSGPDRDPSPRRAQLLVIVTVLAALALVAVLGGAFLSTALTRSPAGTAPAEINPTGENPNQREGRVQIPLPAINGGENPNQREGRVPIPPPAINGGENPNQREGRVPGQH